jgi:SAM-dependent methyltransferase
MIKTDVGKSWDERSRSGESSYASMDPTEVERFRCTAEIYRLVSLLKATGGLRALEAGCGSGKFSLSLASHGFFVTALDCTLPSLKNALRLTVPLKIRPGRLKLVCGDIERPPVREGSYDMVFNEGVVEHWLDRAARVRVIKEMAAMVREGGSVVIYVPNGGHPFHERWVRTGYPGYSSAPPMTLYDSAKLKMEMEEAGLKDVRVDGIMAFYSLNLWPHRRWLHLPLAVLNRYFPLPKSLRCRWGVLLLGIGRK